LKNPLKKNSSEDLVGQTMNTIVTRKVHFLPAMIKKIQNYYNPDITEAEHEEQDSKKEKKNSRTPFISLYSNSKDMLKFIEEVIQYDIRSVFRQSLAKKEGTKKKSKKYNNISENELNVHTVLLDVFLVTFSVQQNSNIEVNDISVVDDTY